MVTDAKTLDREFYEDTAQEEGGRKWAFFWWTIITLLIIALLWPYVIVKIDPGHVGVLYRRFFGGTEMRYVFKEGTHSIFPWDTMYKFDVRLQNETLALSALNRIGLTIDLEATIIFHPISVRTPELLTEVGTDFIEKILIPALRSSIIDTVASHGTEDFFNESIDVIQDEILVMTVSAIDRMPVMVDNILIRNIRVPRELNEAINKKIIAEQKVLEERNYVEVAKEKYKKSYVNASAVRLTQEIVNPLMTPSFLRYKGIEATENLAASPNSKVVIVGNRDGLPLILNLEGEAASKAQNSPLTPALPAMDPAQSSNAVQPGTSSGGQNEPGAESIPGFPQAADRLSLSEAPKPQMDSFTASNLEKLVGTLSQAIGLSQLAGPEQKDKDQSENNNKSE
ncbi:MAG: prohibitin family protein [Deltaproteobacteria bacterium]|jgi:regulator of protease activity HflC (stomatin/prohibitin superfamily)|nr:prohibitin family protein [Deltaproteobacteria bacterium]